MSETTDPPGVVYGIKADELRDRLRRSAPAPAYGAWLRHVKSCPRCTGVDLTPCTAEPRLWSAASVR